MVLESDESVPLCFRSLLVTNYTEKSLMTEEGKMTRENKETSATFHETLMRLSSDSNVKWDSEYHAREGGFQNRNCCAELKRPGLPLQCI